QVPRSPPHHPNRRPPRNPPHRPRIPDGAQRNGRRRHHRRSRAPLTFGFLRAWDSMRVVSPTQCRPFSADRDGMTIGEGAAMITIETLASAQARNAPIYAEIVGFGFSADAGHITQPQAEGAASAMRQAIADANATPEEVGYISAHGTGTQA